jgi:hypothetical protein
MSLFHRDVAGHGAAWAHDLVEVLTADEVTTFADKAYQGAGATVRTPFKRHATRPRLSRGQKATNRAHARIRALGERAVSLLKDWKVLTELRCWPTPSHRDHRGHPRPAPRRDPPQTTMKKARWSVPAAVRGGGRLTPSAPL